MLPIAKAAELFCYMARPIRNMQPVLTPLEIRKLTTTHYFSTEKAVADLEYPIISYIKFIIRFDHIEALSHSPRTNVEKLQFNST